MIMDIGKIFDMLERSKVNPADVNSFPTIYQQTGHRRMGPVALIQDTDALLEVYRFNYDYSVEEFQDYCKGRGVPCFNISDWGPSDSQNPGGAKIAHIHAAKMQDCWELYLRKIHVLEDEDYNRPRKTDAERVRVLLNTIYRKTRI